MQCIAVLMSVIDIKTLFFSKPICLLQMSQSSQQLHGVWAVRKGRGYTYTCFCLGTQNMDTLATCYLTQHSAACQSAFISSLFPTNTLSSSNFQTPPHKTTHTPTTHILCTAVIFPLFYLVYTKAKVLYNQLKILLKNMYMYI